MRSGTVDGLNANGINLRPLTVELLTGETIQLSTEVINLFQKLGMQAATLLKEIAFCNISTGRRNSTRESTRIFNCTGSI